MTNGSRPSVLTLGFASEEIASTVHCNFTGWGKSSSVQTSLAPKAEGSVHMPYSVQKPGRNMASGKVLCAVRLASNHVSRSAKYSSIFDPYQPGSHGLSIINPVSYTHLRAHETDSYLVCR